MKRRKFLRTVGLAPLVLCVPKIKADGISHAFTIQPKPPIVATEKRADGLILSVGFRKNPTDKIVITGIERNNSGHRYGFPNGFWRYPLPLQFTGFDPFYPDNIGKPVRCSKKAKPVKVGSQPLRPICEISVESAQYLFNRLWEEGFRPLEGVRENR